MTKLNYHRVVDWAMHRRILDESTAQFQMLKGTEEHGEMVSALESITKLESETRDEYLKRCAGNKWALMVKIADTLSNLECSFASREQRRITKYLNQLDKLRSYM